MVLIRTRKTFEGKDKIVYVHYEAETLSEKDRSNGVLLEELLDPVERENYVATQYYDYDKKEVLTEYTSVLGDETAMTRLEQLENDIADLLLCLV